MKNTDLVLLKNKKDRIFIKKIHIKFFWKKYRSGFVNKNADQIL